jgi:hypothetical protein
MQVCGVCGEKSGLLVTCTECGASFCIHCGDFSVKKCVKCQFEEDDVSFDRSRWIEVNGEIGVDKVKKRLTPLI